MSSEIMIWLEVIFVPNDVELLLVFKHQKICCPVGIRRPEDPPPPHTHTHTHSARKGYVNGDGDGQRGFHCICV